MIPAPLGKPSRCIGIFPNKLLKVKGYLYKFT